MFTLIVTVLAVLVAVGFLFRIADTVTTDSATMSVRNLSESVTASQALRASQTLRPSVHSRDVS